VNDNAISLTGKAVQVVQKNYLHHFALQGLIYGGYCYRRHSTVN